MNLDEAEIVTQKRVVDLFEKKLGYTYLGNWQYDRENSNIEVEYLKKYLNKSRYSPDLISKAINEFTNLSGNQQPKLYDLNKAVYSALRYGIKVRENPGESPKTVMLINWDKPRKNDFYIAEEVTVKGSNVKRPDLIIYVNGIALGVIELKKSTVSVSKGIRQNIDNQKESFIKQFFATMGFIMAGNDSENIRSLCDTVDYRLDKNIISLCEKHRFIEILHDFIVFDRGTKKACRPNQYFGVKASQLRINKREGGIVWHTQGSGKSLTMVWLTKWIKENKKDSRILVITDRTELDEQIEKVYKGVDENIYRTKSGVDLINNLNEAKPAGIWIYCRLYGFI